MLYCKVNFYIKEIKMTTSGTPVSGNPTATTQEFSAARAIADLEALRARYEDQTRRKARIDAEIESNKRQRDQVAAKMRELYGTDDLQKLKVMLLERRDQVVQSLAEITLQVNTSQTYIDQAEVVLGIQK
jgi:hypothetical protein